MKNSQISDIQHEVEAETETAETNSSLSYHSTPLPASQSTERTVLRKNCNEQNFGDFSSQGGGKNSL